MTNSDRFFELLRGAPAGAVFNPWYQRDAGTDLARDPATARRARLAAHLDCNARLVLVGEGAGYQGAHVSGIAFTSERLILEGSIPRVASSERLSTRERPWSEPSATTVWGTLHALGLAEVTVLWNCFPWHPHKPGLLQSNRTPTREEYALGLPVLAAFLALQPQASVLAVGKGAEAGLRALGVDAHCVRHPSMGGAPAFRAGLAEWKRRQRGRFPL